jgi:beta-lactamase class A
MKAIKIGIGVALILASFTLGSLRHSNSGHAQVHKKPARTTKKSSWQTYLQQELEQLTKLHPHQLGLYIKDLNTGEEFSLNAEDKWYLASTVKIPIAIEVLRQVDAKKISLDDKVVLIPEDFVDGNGPLQYLLPGSQVTIRYLIEQMIIWSDNIASDMLLRVVGLENVNQLAQQLSEKPLSITSLKDVRRHLFSELNTKAFELSGSNFLELKKIQDPNKKLAKLASLMQLELKDLKLASIHQAYLAYYQKGINTGSPKDFSRILERLWEGDILSSESREFMLQTMLKTQTGKNRIRAGLKRPWVFAHKTGTQYERVADVGYIWNTQDQQRRPIIVASFVRDVSKVQESAKMMEEIAKIISRSGLL